MSRSESNGNERCAYSPQPPVARLCQILVFALIVVVMLWAPLAFGSVRMWALIPVVGLVWLATVLWVVRLIATGQSPVVFSALGAPVLLAATYAIIRYGLVEVEWVARRDFFVGLSATLLFFLVLNNVRHRWQLGMLLWLWVGLGTLIAVYGIAQVIGLSDSVWGVPQFPANLSRASGPFISPAQYAAYLQLAFPLTAASFLFSRRSLKHKIGLAFACLLMSAGLLLSFANGAWLGWLASLMVLAVYVIRKRGSKLRWAVVGGSTAGLLIVMALISLQIVRQHTYGLQRDQTMDPLRLWKSAVAVGRENVLLGVGPGMFRWHFPQHRTMQAQPFDAGSEYLNIFAEYGVIGCVLLIWLAVAFIIAVVRILLGRAARYSAATPSNRFAFAVGGLAALAGTLVQAVFASTLHAPANLLTLAVICAGVLTCGVHHHAEEDEDADNAGHYAPVRLTQTGNLLLAGALVALLVLFGPRLLATFKSDYWMRRAANTRAAFNYNAAEDAYVRAWKADRRCYEVAVLAGDFFAARATWNVRQRDTLAGEALKWYERASSRNPYARDVLLKTGKLYDALGQRELAAERFQTALEADPNNSAYHIEVALHYRRWGDIALAEESFREAERLEMPADAAPLTVPGRVVETEAQ